MRIQRLRVESFAEDIELEFPPCFDGDFGPDVVAELDASPAVEAAVGLLVPARWAVWVGGDGVGDGVTGAGGDFEFDGGADGGGGESAVRGIRRMSAATAVEEGGHGGGR